MTGSVDSLKLDKIIRLLRSCFGLEFCATELVWKADNFLKLNDLVFIFICNKYIYIILVLMKFLSVLEILTYVIKKITKINFDCTDLNTLFTKQHPDRKAE